MRWRDAYPCLFDSAQTTVFDPHYLYQAVWAMERIARENPRSHVDVGSEVKFAAMLTSHVPVLFVDIRPLLATLNRFACIAGSILALPVRSGSVGSLSCLHVAEHVGLGRYGDRLDPMGTAHACAELRRVLSDGGNLFFSLPIGRPRVCFNAHRIHRTDQIIEYFKGLTLVEFSAVDSRGRFLVNANRHQMDQEEYGCGLFWFRKNGGLS